MTALKPKLRWFQFSLRTLLVFVTLCAIPCSWIAVKRQQARQERNIAAAFERVGGDVKWSKPSESVWLRSLLGDDIFRHVESVDVCWHDAPVGDADLRDIRRLSYLRSLCLNATSATDATLGNVKGLKKLRYLQLFGTRISDAGLANLKDLDKLEYIDLTNTDITDVGLGNLEALGQLKDLDLCNTKVTDAGVRKLQQALPNCVIAR